MTKQPDPDGSGCRGGPDAARTTLGSVSVVVPDTERRADGARRAGGAVGGVPLTETDHGRDHHGEDGERDDDEKSGDGGGVDDVHGVASLVRPPWPGEDNSGLRTTACPSAR